MLLPPQFKDEALKTLGPPLRKEEEKKPVEVEVKPGIYRVNGKLETRIRENEDPGSYPSWVQIPKNEALNVTGTLTINGPTSIGVSEIDIPLPEFNGVWRPIKECPLDVLVKIRSPSFPNGWKGVIGKNWICIGAQFGWEWLDEGC